MVKKFKDKYRSESTRLIGRDYAAPGKYYVTINTFGRQPFFGKIIDDRMILSDVGIIAKTCYLEIPNHFKNVKLDEYVIMPDHIHGIIEILGFDAIDDGIIGDDGGGGIIGDDGGGGIIVDTSHGAYLQPQKSSQHPQKTDNPYHKPQWKPGTLGVIINQFKSSVTRIVNSQQGLNISPNGANFGWQALFHDRIIRNDEYERIKLYIRNNVKNLKKHFI